MSTDALPEEQQELDIDTLPPPRPLSNGPSPSPEPCPPDDAPLLQNATNSSQSGPAHTVVVQQPTPSTGIKFRDLPVVMTDENGDHYTTELRYVNGVLTWVAVGITCLMAGSFCCPCLGLIPLCISDLKDVEHINPNDGSVVGKYDRGADLGLK